MGGVRGIKLRLHHSCDFVPRLYQVKEIHIHTSQIGPGVMRGVEPPLTLPVKCKESYPQPLS